MDAKTLEALHGSIEKWRKIVEEGGEDDANRDCPLCELYHSVDCDGCPVSEKTGGRFCGKSPYREWMRHRFSEHRASRRTVQCPECERLARAELDFLKSLLPEGEQ